MEKILEIKDLSKTYKSFKLEHINFNLDKGYIMGFIGPNGIRGVNIYLRNKINIKSSNNMVYYLYKILKQ